MQELDSSDAGCTLYCKCTNFQANHNPVCLAALEAVCCTLYCKCTNFQANHNLGEHVWNVVKVALYIANVLTFKRITTERVNLLLDTSCTLYCKCTNFQANHNSWKRILFLMMVGLYIANVLTFKRITTGHPVGRSEPRVGLYIANVLTFKRITTKRINMPITISLDSILQMY